VVGGSGCAADNGCGERKDGGKQDSHHSTSKN
jgi:hypothetical protein